MRSGTRLAPRAAAALGVLLLAGGCATVSSRAPAPEASLSPEDQRLHKSLAHFAQGLLYEAEVGRGSELALQEFAQASALDPQRHALYVRQARIQFAQQAPDEAIRTLRESCRHSPTSITAHVDLAMTCELAGRVEEAIEAYRAVQRLAPRQVAPYAAIARLQFLRGRDREALRTLRQGARRASPPEALAVVAYTEGLGFSQKNQPLRAAACMEFVAGHLPVQRGAICQLLGDLYLAGGRRREAARAFTQATRETPPPAMAYVKLAMLDLERGPQHAVRRLEKARRLLPDDPLVPLALGQIYSGMERYADAIAVYDTARALAGASGTNRLTAAFYLQYGAAHERSGQLEKAEEIFRNCLAEFPDAHAVMNYLAYMWAEKGRNLEQGLRHINRALELSPDNGAYLDTRGWIYYRLGRFEEAAQNLARADGLQPRDPTITDHLGDVFQALQQPAKAADYWAQSLKLDPGNEAVAAKLREHGVDVEALRRKAKE